MLKNAPTPEMEGFQPTRAYPSRRPMSLPEQIAEDASRRILAGDLRPGQRLGEIEMAAHYGVSRGPVREALRELEKRGLATVQPRRGAFVARIDNDAIADIFNIRAANLGLAARYAATMASHEALMEIEARVSALEQLARIEDVDPVEFALASGRAGAAIGRAAGSPILKSVLVAFAEGMFWGLIWREHRIDFLTVDRRVEVAAKWRHVMGLLNARDGAGAETALRDLLHENRDKAFDRLRLPGSPAPDPRRMIRAGGATAGS